MQWSSNNPTLISKDKSPNGKHTLSTKATPSDSLSIKMLDSEDSLDGFPSLPQERLFSSASKSSRETSLTQQSEGMIAQHSNDLSSSKQAVPCSTSFTLVHLTCCFWSHCLFLPTSSFEMDFSVSSVCVILLCTWAVSKYAAEPVQHGLVFPLRPLVLWLLQVICVVSCRSTSRLLFLGILLLAKVKTTHY